MTCVTNRGKYAKPMMGYARDSVEAVVGPQALNSTAPGSRRAGGFALLATATASLLVAGCGRPQWAGSEKAPDTAPRASSPTVSSAPHAVKDGPSISHWAVDLLGRNPRSVFARNGVCVGNTDRVIEKYTGSFAGAKIAGWGWDVATKRHVQRVILVDQTYTIVGAGDGGLSRADVPRVRPEITDGETGWNATTRMTSGPLDAYGVVGNGTAICPLGHLEL